MATTAKMESVEASHGDDWVPSRFVEETEDGKKETRYLPPIYRLQMPETRTKSALIRWLWELGYDVKTISKGLDIRYQQVRNIITTEPKRAAREDLPPLSYELIEVEDVVDMLLGEALEQDFKKAHKARQQQQEEGEDHE